MMRISFTLQAFNRVTAPVNAAMRSIQRITSVTRGISASMEKMGVATASVTRKMSSNMGNVARAAVSMSQRIGASFMGTFDRMRDMTHHFRGVIGDERMARAGRSIEYLKRQVSGLTAGFTLLKYAGIAAGIGLAEEFVRGVFRAGGQMQQLQVTLNKLEGGPANAARAMSFINRFAMGAGASMSMPDIMKSYQMAKEGGLNPQQNLPAYADAAASWRVPLSRVIFAVKDAVLGTSTRPLANLGIHIARGHGDGPSTFSYQNLAGKWVHESVSKGEDSTLAAITRIFGLKFGGIARAQADTVPGGFAQLQKLLYIFQGRVAASGLFTWLKLRMNQFFELLRRWQDSGLLDRAARSISDFLVNIGNRAIIFAARTDWVAIGKDLMLFVTAIGGLAKGLMLLSNLGGGGLSGLLNLFVASKIIGITSALVGLVAPLYSVGAALAAFEIAALPIEGIIALVAGLAAIAWLVYANWATVGPRLTKLFKKLWADITPPQWLMLLSGGPGGIAGAIGQNIGQKIGGAMRPQASPETPRQKWMRDHPETPQRRAADQARARDIARADIRISVEGGNPNAVQVRALHRAEGVDLSIKRGIVNGAPG